MDDIHKRQQGNTKGSSRLSLSNTKLFWREGIVNLDKQREYEERRKLARQTNNCAFCGNPLHDRRKIYCNSDHADKFWEECNYWQITWFDIRNQALERDNYKCVKCGQTNGLEVDHIIEIADGGPQFELSNLQTLCHQCHLDKTAQGRHNRIGRLRIERIRSQHIPLL